MGPPVGLGVTRTPRGRLLRSNHASSSDALENLDLGTPLVGTGSPADIDAGDLIEGSDPINSSSSSAGGAPMPAGAGSRRFSHNMAFSAVSAGGAAGSSSSGSFGKRQSSLNTSTDSSHDSPNSSLGLSRPLPDQSVFDRPAQLASKAYSAYSPSASPVCPATPMRTPSWSQSNISIDASADSPAFVHAHSHVNVGVAAQAPAGAGVGVAAGGGGSAASAAGGGGGAGAGATVAGGGGGGQFMFSSSTMAARQSTLQDSLLLSQSESDGTSHDGINVSFERDFVDEGPLGSGQFADVFKVRPSVCSSLPASEGQHFAVKRSRSEMRSKKEREWLLHEVKIMKLVGARPSPYLIRLVRAWQEGGFFFMQLTLAEKGSVKDLLVDLSMQGKVLTDSTAWHIFHNAVSGLQHIHACGIVHNDIKPANLLITSSGVVQIGDFGIALEHGKFEDGREGDARFVAIFSLTFFLPLPSTHPSNPQHTTHNLLQVHGARGAKHAWQDAQR